MLENSLASSEFGAMCGYSVNCVQIGEKLIDLARATRPQRATQCVTQFAFPLSVGTLTNAMLLSKAI